MGIQENADKTNLISGVLDMLGLPRLDKILPAPADVVEISDIAIIGDIIKQ